MSSSKQAAHTPEPWSVRRVWSNGCDACPEVYGGEDGRRWIASFAGCVPPSVFDESLANAERVCACVNHLAGIPTADLLARPTASQVTPLVAELVGAAEEAATAIRKRGPWDADRPALSRLEAAVAALRKVGA